MSTAIKTHARQSMLSLGMHASVCCMQMPYMYSYCTSCSSQGWMFSKGFLHTLCIQCSAQIDRDSSVHSTVIQCSTVVEVSNTRSQVVELGLQLPRRRSRPHQQRPLKTSSPPRCRASHRSVRQTGSTTVHNYNYMQRSHACVLYSTCRALKTYRTQTNGRPIFMI